MRTKPKVGEVWVADLGMVAKTRPVLVMAEPSAEDARPLVVVVPLTSQIRGMRGEVPLGPVQWLPKLSAVNVQGILPVLIQLDWNGDWAPARMNRWML